MIEKSLDREAYLNAVEDSDPPALDLLPDALEAHRKAVVALVARCTTSSIPKTVSEKSSGWTSFLYFDSTSYKQI